MSLILSAADGGADLLQRIMARIFNRGRWSSRSPFGWDTDVRHSQRCAVFAFHLSPARQDNRLRPLPWAAGERPDFYGSVAVVVGVGSVFVADDPPVVCSG